MTKSITSFIVILISVLWFFLCKPAYDLVQGRRSEVGLSIFSAVQVIKL